MQYIALAIDRDGTHLLKKTRVKISEWLDYKKAGSNTIVTIYLEFSDSEKPYELDHVYLIIPKDDLKCINLPNENEIRKENEALKNKELSKRMDMEGRFIQPIFIKDISIKEVGEYAQIRIDFERFEVDNRKTNKCQFRFYARDSLRKKPWLSITSGSSWDWNYEARIRPLTIDEEDFPEIVQVKMDLELWVMVGPAMYDSVSDLTIRSTQPYDRFVILSGDVARNYERNFVCERALCIRWFFGEFSESGLSHEIIMSKKRSAMEKEMKYIEKINSDDNYFFSVVDQILNDSRITCIDFGYIINKLENQEFSRFLDILFELMYHRDDEALEKFEEFINTLEELQNLKYGKYYLRLYRLINQMRSCKRIGEIIAPHIRKNIEEFVNEPEYINKAIKGFFKELNQLVDLIERFNYYTMPEEKYSQEREILQKITQLRRMAERSLINPESYLLAEQVLITWEHLVETEFEQFVGTPQLDMDLKTKRLLYSGHTHLVFDVKNTGEIPLFHLEARLLPSEQYDVSEQERAGTRKRERLTKSDFQNERIFSPEFVIHPKDLPHVNVQLEVEFVTEKGKTDKRIFNGEIELFHEGIPFKEREQNPYVVGNPIKTEDMFYGREDVFRKIYRTIDSPLVNQTIIYGQHRIGKTSILCQLMNKLKGKYIPVLAITHGLETGDSELLTFWSNLISDAVKERGIIVPAHAACERIDKCYSEFRKFIVEITEKLKGIKILLMIDEYDMIDDFIQQKGLGKEIFNLLDWMTKYDKIELLMAGRLPMENLETEEWKEIARPFGQVKLGPLDRESAEKLIREPVKGFLEYDDSAIERIIKLTNCHPYLLQLCCHVLLNYHDSQRKSFLTYADIEDCIPEMIVFGTNGLEAMVLKDANLHEKILLEVMADALEDRSNISEQELVVRIREHNPQIEDKDIKKATLNLKERDIIRSTTEKTEEFKFVCELFKYWIDAKRATWG